MEDLILENVQLATGILAGAVTVFVVWRKKHSSKVQTVFKTTQFKKGFKRHQMQFNEQFKSGNSLFK